MISCCCFSPSEAGEEVGGGEFVRFGACAGEIGLTIGLARVGGGAGLDGETREMEREVVLECRGMGGLSKLDHHMRSLNPSTAPLPIL